MGSINIPINIVISNRNVANRYCNPQASEKHNLQPVYLLSINILFDFLHEMHRNSSVLAIVDRRCLCAANARWLLYKISQCNQITVYPFMKLANSHRAYGKCIRASYHMFAHVASSTAAPCNSYLSIKSQQIAITCVGQFAPNRNWVKLCFASFFYLAADAFSARARTRFGQDNNNKWCINVPAA